MIKDKDWPNLLVDFRTQHNLTRNQLGDYFQIPVSLIEDWETGRKIPEPYLKQALKGFKHAK